MDNDTTTYSYDLENFYVCDSEYILSNLIVKP